ncbi:MAG: alpha/beta hydrolase [Proteobacteria bacterium]|nr:alpha/beta hydrolase [Pseudomonadota bacterium]
MPEVLFNGPAGRLEGRYSPGKSPTAPIALVLHPSPQHGGTMNNKVVFSIYQTFTTRDFATLRFNFRGVGRSQGSYDKGEGELADATSALDWLQSINLHARSVWVAGFSFGSWIGMQLLMRRPEIDSFISIAPPANMLDFSFLAPCPTSGMIVTGEADDIVPEPAVAKLVHKLSFQRGIKIDYRAIPGADHFFTDKMDELSAAVESHLDAALFNPASMGLALAG